MKKLIKKLLIPVLASAPVAMLASRLIGSGIPIFMLHRIAFATDAQTGTITPEHLRRCLAYLRDNDYALIPLEQLITTLANGEAPPSRAVVFTMDDGFVDQAEISAPIFLEFDCPLTFFVITGMLDQALWPWDAQISWLTETTREPVLRTDINGQVLELDLGDRHGRRRAKHRLQDILRTLPADRVTEAVHALARAARLDVPEQPPATYRPMDWDTARALERRGIRFGPHSVSHRIMSRLDDGALREEISASWQTMERQLENPLKVFCYPNGRRVDYGQREVDLLRGEGFLGAVSTVSELLDPGRQPHGQLFNLPRLALPDTMDNFIQCCTWIEYAKQIRAAGDSR